MKCFNQFSFKTFRFLLLEAFTPQSEAAPDFLHAAMRPDVIGETEVEITTEDCCEEDEEEDEEEEMVTSLEEPEPDNEPVRKKRGAQTWRLSSFFKIFFIFMLDFFFHVTFMYKYY